jgi:hypothetical protein
MYTNKRNLQYLQGGVLSNEMIKKLLLKNATSEPIEKLREQAIKETSQIDQQINDLKNKTDKVDVIGSCLTCGKGGDLRVTKMKPEDSFPYDVNKALNLIVKNRDNGEVFGSYIYRAQTFPSDIDSHEIIEVCCSKEELSKEMEKIIKKIVNGLKGKRGVYYSEIKGGIDHRFKIDVDDDFFNEKIDKLFHDGLLKKDELDDIKTLYRKADKDSLDVLKELLRLKYTLRWSEDEIKKGYKMLIGNVKKTLRSAIEDGGLFKIDIWAPINGRYIEVTNVFRLFYIKKGTGEIISLENPFDYVNNIKEQIRKFNSNTFFNPFKMAKRMWGLARHLKNNNYLKLLTPLFQGSIARLNQIKAEMETIVLMLERLKTIPAVFLSKQVNEFKSRISYIYNLDFNEKLLDSNFDKISELLLNLNRKNRHAAIDLLNSTMKYIKKEVIEPNTLTYLHDRGLHPLPQFFKFNNIGTGFGGYGTKKGAKKNAYIQHIKKYGYTVPYNKNIPEIPVIQMIPEVPKEVVKVVENLKPNEVKKMNDMIPPNIYIYCGNQGIPTYSHSPIIPEKQAKEIVKLEKEILKLPEKEKKNIEKVIDKRFGPEKAEKREVKKLNLSKEFLRDLEEKIASGPKF